MIFLSNKFDRRKVVDSADSDSVDSFVKTPIKNEELMAPPYSPLSPLCRKSPRHLTGSPLRSPRHLKSPLAVRNNVLESPKSLKTTQNQDVVPTGELNADSCLSSQLVKESTNETSEKDDSSKKLSKNLFGAPENEQESCPEEELKTTKKVKKLKKKETTCGQNNSVNDEITSDEDFKTPKKKPKPARKKKAEEKPNNSEKMVKDDRGKKKESPNPNSSLLNYFKKVEVSKDVEVNQIENVDETTPSLAETGDISDSKQSENSVEKKRNKKKKAKKKKRKDCVEIRFDFESDASVELGEKEEAIEKSESEDLKGDCIRENERAIPNEDDCKESLEMENDKGKEEVTKPVEKLEQASNDRLETKEKQEDEHKRNSETDKHCGDSGNKEDNKDSKEEKEELSEVPKKRGRGRPKKVKTEHEANKTDIKEEESSERREIEEPELTEVEGEEEVHDDKENERKRRRKSRKREKKELQEHCDNVDGSGGDEEESKPKEATSLFKYFKKVDSIVDADCKRDSNVLKVEVQIHTPPSTPKSKRKSKPPLSPLPPPTLTPSGDEGRRKSSRISEKMKLKEEAKKIEDEILVLEEEESGKKKSKRKHGGQDSDDEVFILKEKKAPSFSPGPQSKVKLASIFLKKPKLTKMQTEARQRFLQSGVPDAIRRQTELLRNQPSYRKVIELNASCNRNGKRILSDLSEATQSHQVQHQTQSCAPITSFFSKQPSQNPPNEQRTGEKSLKLSSQEGKTTEKSLKVYSQEGKGKRESAKRKREEDTPEKPARKSQIKKKKGDKTEDKSDRHPAKSKGAKTGEKVVKKKGESKEKTSQKRRGTKEAESGLESEGHFTKNVGNLGIPVGNFGKTAGNFTSVGTFSVKSEEKEPAGEKDEAKMSLILIEDADVLFSDHDDGFVSALSSLVASSKRPLILVTSQERVTHLVKFMRLPHSLVLHFTTPLYTEIGSFLQLIAILEGVKLSQDKSLLLIHHNRGDIRKCLLALQYYVLSRKCYPSQSTPPWAGSEAANLAAIWWQWSSLYKLSPLLYNHTRTKLTLHDHEETHNGQVEHTASRELQKSKNFLDDEFFCDGNEKNSVNDIKNAVNDERDDNTAKETGAKKIGTKSELPEEVQSVKDARTNGENDPENIKEMGQTEEVGQSKLGNGQSSQSNENEDESRRSTGDDMESNEKDESNENIPLPNSEESGYSSSCQNSQQDSEQSNQQNSQPLSQQNSQQDQEMSQQSRRWGQQNSETMSQRNSQQGQEQCQQNSQQSGSLSQQNSANLQFLKTSFASRFASLSQFESSKAEMRNLSRLLTCYSQVDLIHGKLDVSCADSNPCPRIWESCPSASSSLELSSLSSQSMLCRDLGASLISCARGLVPGEITLSVNGPWEETKRHTHQLFALERSLLSSLSPSEALSRYGFPLDLYSGVRGLARIERHRFETSSKRYNRFFNHLKSVNIHLSKSETERLCASLSLTD
ncbi:daf-12-interacting protein 1 [Diaphorina citri]|uniref:Daf-12-interacting protein 1 n=1 Tax=Diaphorina citri TaxID=121845 RepID=A0A3Q0JN68_DIACI|nr:daf-12-interacting protein 1 [Diaphorina citri]